MNALPKISSALLFVFAASFAPGQANAADVEGTISALKSADADVRVEALRAVQTSLDPRLPDLMLGLLSDSGDSIRRLAARGVGSRWWQIPAEQQAAFVKALKRNEKSELEDEANMVQRALGLLNRDYRGPMFSRSPSGRWVVYERLGLPCLIDTKSETEELLGWRKERSGWISSAWGNGPLDTSVSWHPRQEMAAIGMLLNRKESALWVWQHGAGLTPIETSAIVKAAGYRDADLFRAAGVFTEVKGWKGDELQFSSSFTTQRGEKQAEHELTFGWNSAKKSLRVISK